MVSFRECGSGWLDDNFQVSFRNVLPSERSSNDLGLCHRKDLRGRNLEGGPMKGTMKNHAKNLPTVGAWGEFNKSAT